MIEYQLRDFQGVVVHRFRCEAPLQFPYLIWKDRLYVASRDDTTMMLERSFHILMMDEQPPQQVKKGLSLAN